MKPVELIQRILEIVTSPTYRPVKIRVLASKLGLEDSERRALRVTVRKLVRQGRLAYGPNHLVLPVTTLDSQQLTPPPAELAVPASESEWESESEGMESESEGMESTKTEFEDTEAAESEMGETSSETARAAGASGAKNKAARGRGGERAVVTGTFRRAAAGYGFVRPRGTTSGDRTGDIFVPATGSRDAASGDLVTVRIDRRFRRGQERISGEIIEILERDTHRFVGRYYEQAGSGYVRVDGNLFSQPISVGDASAKSAFTDDKVVIEMVRFPSHWSEGEAVIVEVLGPSGQPGVDTLGIIHEYNLPLDFPADVLEDARRQAERFDESDLAGREDWTAATVITIDPVDARDFDDAISLVRLEQGHWQLAVHIADVGHFVPAGSALDREARERGTSVYLPDRVIPMLPEVISNHLASLQPQQVRLARTVVMEMTPEGTPVATDVLRTAIRSCRRFTYEEVDDYLADPAAWQSQLSPEVHQLLARMAELARTLRDRRLRRGALELTLPEIKLKIDRRGEVEGAYTVVNTFSHQIIEEFMLAANEAVASLLRTRGRSFLRRVHASPEPRKLKALTTFVRELGISCESLESRFEIQRVIDEVRERPERQAVNYAVLRSMQKAHYAPIEEGHYALNSRDYCHFTSPIRRYPDLTVHRLFDQLAKGKRSLESAEQLLSLGEHCSEREQRAQAAERELIKIKLLTYMSRRIGQQMEAIVTGVESFGLFAQGLQIPAEGLLSIHSLRDDHYDYDSTTHRLVGRRAGNAYRLGDVIQVEIARVDIDRRELDFRLVGGPRQSVSRSRTTAVNKNKKKTEGRRRRR
ncbi:MAG: ribonuclease R [Planctomycetota bacterium]